MAGKGWNLHAGLLWIDEKAIWIEKEHLTTDKGQLKVERTARL